MQLIDGRALAAKIHKEIAQEVRALEITPGLGVILVGENPASHLYVALKEKAAKEVGIKFEKYVFRGTEPEAKIIEKIRELNAREDIHGILVQVPLPPAYSEDAIINTIDPKKDADGFHQVNLRAILAGEPRIFPAVALAIVALIDEACEKAKLLPAAQHKSLALDYRKAILLVNRTEFAAPLEYLLEERGALVHIILRAKTITPDIAAQLKKADVLVVARGHAGIIKGEMIKDGTIVIDVGTNKLPDGRVVGDVDFASSRDKPGFITPVPGGVGPMTVAMLLKNVLELAK